MRVVLILMIFLLLASYAHANEWAMFRKCASRTGYSDLTGNINKPILKWSFKASAPIDSSPAIVNLNEKSIIVFGSNNFTGSDVYIVEGNNGDKLWNYSISNAIFSSPAIWDINNDRKKEIVVGADDGNLYVFGYSSLFNFDILWSYPVNGSWPAVSSSPAIANVNDEPIIIFGAYGSPNVYALYGDGSSLWNYTTGSWGIFSSPAIAKMDSVYHVIFGSYDGNVYDLNAKDGSLIWNHSIGVFVEGTPAIIEDDEPQIIIGANNGIYSFNKSGDLSWNFSCGQVRGGVGIGDITNDNRTDIVFGCYDNFIYAFDRNGTMLWKFETGDKIFSSPLIADIDGDNELEIVLGSLDKTLYALNGKDGSMLWNYTTNGPITSSPAIADIDGDDCPEIVFGSGDNNLYAIDGGPEDVEANMIVENNPFINQTYMIVAEIKNNGCLDENVDIAIYINGITYEHQRLFVGDGEIIKLGFNWTPNNIGMHNLTLIVDPENKINETNEDNNIISSMVNVSEGKSVDVAIIVKLNKTIFKRCINLPKGLSGYEILEETGLNISWAWFDLYGHALCGIEEVGCPSSNCWCSPYYWNFYIAKSEEPDWTYSPVGFDGGISNPTCWNGNYSSYTGHFCVADGYMIGLAYGSYGTKPPFCDFYEVCKKVDGSSCNSSTQCLSGYCVHGTCRASATYCGDRFCDKGETCSSCPDDCGSCHIVITGYSSLPRKPLTSHTWSIAMPEKPIVMVIDEKEIALTLLMVKVKERTNNARISVEKLEERPKNIKDIDNGKIYQYIKITHENLENKIKSVNLEFAINKSWLNENNLSIVTLNRYHYNSWQKLKTNKINETKNNIIYESRSPGLSIFAITASKEQEIVSKIQKPEEKKETEPSKEEKKSAKEVTGFVTLSQTHINIIIILIMTIVVLAIYLFKIRK